MTIAACYVSSEGVVLGADSTSTLWVAGPDGSGGTLHHLNYAQKVFEVGRDSTLGITMWGMGGIGDLSHRTLVTQFADDLVSNPVRSMREVAERFAQRFWREYSGRLATDISRYRELSARRSEALTEEEKQQLFGLQQHLSGGFCLGGYLTVDRSPHAYEIAYTPQLVEPPVPRDLRRGSGFFWGCPNIIQRVLFCWDQSLFDSIVQSGKWQGSPQELFDLIMRHRIAQPFDLPLREAVDWVHSVIYSTIKAMKFSHHLPVCGGPIELAVISTDRLFRWVRHKRFDEAIQ